MKRVLIVGISSCIGSNLAIYLRKYYKVFGTYHTYHPKVDGVVCFRFPIEAGSPIEAMVKFLKPDGIIYCVAQTAERLCKEDPVRTLLINAEAAEVFARAASHYGARLIYLSSSKVYSGEQGNYKEQDRPNPISVYGRSKMIGEELIRRYENVFSIRLGTIFGLGSQGQQTMLGRMLRALWKNEELPLILDEYRSFMSVADLSRIVGILVDTKREDAQTFNLGTGERNTYYSFGLALAQLFGLPTGNIKPVNSDGFSNEYADKSLHRGRDLTLDGSLLRERYGFRYQTLENSLQELKRNLNMGTY